MLGHEIDYPQLSIDDISMRAQAYGMPGSSHVGWDVEEVYAAVGDAIKRARDGKGPTLLEFKIHRVEGEDNDYCPVRHYREKLMKEGVLTEKHDREIRDKESKAVKEAIDFAMGSPAPELMDAYKHVYVGG
jgi:pyruvate dehydrogenase E1 component alpha subunit